MCLTLRLTTALLALLTGLFGSVLLYRHPVTDVPMLIYSACDPAHDHCQVLLGAPGGATARVIFETPTLIEASSLSQDWRWIVFYTTRNKPNYLVRTDGSAWYKLPFDPIWSPDQQWIAGIVPQTNDVMITDSTAIDLRVVAGDARALRWSPDREWIIVQPLNASTTTIVRTDGSRTLSLPFFPIWINADGWRLAGVDAASEAFYLTSSALTDLTPVLTGVDAFQGWRLSPDKQWLTFYDSTNTHYIGRVDGAEWQALPFRPIWSPGGQWIVSDPASTSDVYLTPAGAIDPQLAVDDLTGYANLAWSRDAEWVAFSATTTSGDKRLYALRLDGTALYSRPTTPYEVRELAWSPDSRYLAASALSAEERIVVSAIPAEDGDLRRLAEHSDRDGAMRTWGLLWSPDSAWVAFETTRDLTTDSSGRRLYVARPDGSERRMVIPIDSTDGDLLFWADDHTIVFDARARLGGAYEVNTANGELQPFVNGSTPESQETPPSEPDPLVSPNGQWRIQLNDSRLYAIQQPTGDAWRVSTRPGLQDNAYWIPDQSVSLRAYDARPLYEIWAGLLVLVVIVFRRELGMIVRSIR
jgi:Tol biopolymer transport system component